MSQLNLLRYLWLYILVPGIVLALSTSADAQNSYSCDIRSNDVIRTLSTRRVAQNAISVSRGGYSPWNITENELLEDNRHIAIDIDPHLSTEALRFNNFNFDLPENVSITGIEVIITGDSESDTPLWEQDIRLIGSGGNTVGDNKANKELAGDAWNLDTLSSLGYWTYGSSVDLWGSNWSPSDINNNNFGFSLQTKNRSDEIASLSIDQLIIVVYYDNPIIICQAHACIVVTVEADESVVSYNWNVRGLEWEPSNDDPNVINVIADNASFGEYEVCLDRQYDNGRQESCCRAITYQDCSTGSIGDFVWQDLNGNGFQDSGEPGLSDCNVILYTESLSYVASTQTVNGMYLFTDLDPGNYIVQVDVKDYCPTKFDGSNTTLNSDFYNAFLPNSSHVVSLAANEDRRDIDFGLIRKGSVEGLTWIDKNDNGLYEDTDCPIADIKVSIVNTDGDTVRCVISGADGTYVADNVPPGEYTVKFAFPQEYLVTSRGVDSHTLPGHCSEAVTVGENITTTVNAGAFRPSTLGNYVWLDSNENGIQDTDEPGIAGAVITLTSCDDIFIGEYQTDANGNYQISDIAPGTYKICVDPMRDDLEATLSSIGDDTLDSDHVAGTACTACITVGENANDQTYDFGFIESEVLSKIDVYVFEDVNNDGVNDANDPPIPNVKVEIYDCNGSLIADLTTDNVGAVWQMDIPIGNYYIKVTPPLGYTIRPGGLITGANGRGTTDCLSSAPMGFSLEIPLIRYIPNVTISVYEDTDGDGVNGPNDPPLSSISIDIYTCDGVLVANTTTDALGIVLQTLPEGNYYYRIYPPSGYVLGFDSIIDGSNGTDTTPCLPTGPDGLSIEIGLVESNAQIDVYVYHDVDDNGTNDSNDPALPNVGVEIYNCSTGLISSMSTNNLGAVWQYNIENGDYYIKIIPPAGYTIRPGGIITDANGPGTTDCYNSAPIGFSIEVGLILQGDPNVTISVYEDTDGDGVNGPNDPPLSSISIDIYTCDGVLVANTTTDALGIVLQTLPEGNYYYRIYPPSGYVLGFDSIIDGSNGTDTTPCLPTGPDGLSIEIGLVESNAQIDVYVYHDVDDNGTNDPNDPALPNVGVEIYNCSTGLISSMSTNNLGAVWQYNIENGDYYIKIIPPAGYTIRPGGIITDANGPGTTDCLNSAPIGFSIEVGLILIGDPNVTVSVYDDTDGDGVNGPNDPPLSSISIDIYTCDGVLVANTTTDAVGVILETLPEGNYYFRIYPPIGYVIGFGSIIDGSNGTDTTPCLPTGPDGINIEIGLVRSNAQIDVYVYHDVEDNGTNDPNDPALPNVGVEIHNCTTGLISSISTNNVGAVWQYNIENGDYYIKIIPPAGYTIRQGGIITNANGPGTTDCLNSAPTGFSIEVGLINNTPPTGTGIITGVIWQDDDGSSTNDNEPPVSGITVSLYTCNGDFVASTQTDAQGAYAFVDLLPGEYYIEVDSLPGFAFSTGADSGVDNSNGSGTTACISVDDTTVTINAGMAPLSSIGNYVWLDNNVDGIQDANESGVAGIPLVLFDDNELEIANTVTGTQGEYIFSDIAPGNYRIEIRDSRTFGVTLQSIGPEDTDSELRIEGSRLVSEYFTLSGGNDLTDIDMGLTIESAIIGGLVFQDEGLDGVLSNADDRVQDISVHLYSSAGVLTQTLITDTGGAYVFFNVIPGDYYVQFDAASDIVFTMPNIGSDELLDSDVIDTDGRTDIISVEGGDIIQGVNAGLTQTSGCISGVFWDDANRDGILGNGAGSAASENTSNQRLMEERRIDNATVNLYREDGTLVATDITDFDGQYNFCDLEVGNYYVQFTLPDNYVFTIANQGTDELLDSDVTDPVNGTTDIISVNTSNIINGISAGAYEQSTIVSGTFWEDANSDGILSALEIGVSGISINLVAADGSIALTALSNQDGIYTFTDPTAGVYSLSVIVPDSLALTQSMIGADPSLYSHFSESDNSTSTFNITTGEIYNNINAGFIEKEELRPARVSGQVWLDVNRDGILQTIERGISDVTINLMEMDMTIVNTVSTGSDGDYNFTNIPSGDYILEIMNSDTYAMTTAHVGNDPTVYSHFDESSRSSDPIAVSEGDNISNMNGGLIPNIGSMSGTIWLDTDDDGKYDTDENGIQGINVNLLRADESIVSSIFTDASGAYSFTDLDAGDYILEVVSGTTYDHAKGFRGADETIYSHILMNFGRSDIKSIAAGDNLININAGLTEAQVTTSVSGTVWLDTDDDGKYDTDENGIQGINVNLLRADESIVSSIFTDTSGAYSFTDLDAGDYILEVVSGTAYDHAKGFRGADEAIYSHILMNFGRSDIKSIATGDNLMNINAGLTEAQVTTSMSGTVWLDTDDDGKYDTDENGIQGINVNLLRADESIVSSIFTDASGAYSFTDLDAGDYILEVVSGTAYDHAKGFRGADETIYSHILMNIGRSDIKSIAAGDNLININAGLTEAVNTIVSGVVWLDENKNGFLDDTELGLEAIEVELYREGGTLVASTLTAVTGRYTFDGLTAGRYYVLFNMIADHTFTIPRAGGSAPNDSNVTDFNLGTTNIFAIAKGNYFGNIHAGYIRENDPVDTVGSITGYVWEDRNGDGILEIAEGGQNDVVVILYDASGVEVARTTTSNDPDTGRPGYYDFLQIVTGSYTTEYLLDDQAQPTISGQDSALGDDMKIDGFSVSAGTQITVNAGYYFTASIGDYVWQDANENGIQDDSETGAQNFFIKLLDTNDQQVAFTFSDSEGGYAFDNLAPGDYYIQVDFQLGISFSAGGLGDAESDSNINNDNGFGTTSTITLSSGDNNNTIDIGLIVAPATAGDRVFADTNGDGIQDDAEGGIDGIAVMLYDRNDNLIQSTETATVAGESGKYLFEDIKAGNYYIVFDIPAGLDISPQDEGGDDSKDSDVDNSQEFGSTSIFELSAGETDLDIDCGIISSLSIGDRVWHDRDSDGSFDNNEPGVSGVEVTLHDGEGNYLSATTTNNQGIYSFDGLNPGDYYLQFNAPDNFTYTEKGVGAPSIDSDVNEDGSSDLITLTSTSGTRKVSAGLIRPSNEIGGIAWWDNNLDGLYTTDEDLMEGVTVYLLNNNQQLLDEVQTNILGRYVFYDIPNGPYIIQFASEVDMSFTSRNVGGNDKINSAVDADGYSQIVNATGQTVERYINGGLIDIEAPGIAKVYPNPVSGNAIQLEVRSAKDAANISVYLYDMSGRLMDSWTSLQQAKAGLSKYKLPVYDLSGQYIMKVRVGNRVETKKLIILDE